MRVIRHSMFETNSSSLHSIVLVDAKDKDIKLEGTSYNPLKNTYTITYWDPDDRQNILRTPDDKINYLATHVGLDFTIDDIVEFLNSKEPIEKSYSFSDKVAILLAIRDSIRERINPDVIFKVKGNESWYDEDADEEVYDDHANIDHNAYDLISEFVEKELGDNSKDLSKLKDLFCKVIYDPNYFILLTQDGYPYYKWDEKKGESVLDLPEALVNNPK